MDLLTDNPTLLGLILAMFTPLATAVVQQPTWSSRARSVVGAIASLIIGFLTVAASGDLGDATTLLTTLGVVLTAAEAAYQKVWQPTGVTQLIEFATSPRPGSISRSSFLDDLRP